MDTETKEMDTEGERREGVDKGGDGREVDTITQGCYTGTQVDEMLERNVVIHRKTSRK